MYKQRTCWPGLDLRGQTLAEIRTKIRGADTGGSPPPPAGEPERLGEILKRMGFGKQRGRDDERNG